MDDKSLNDPFLSNSETPISNQLHQETSLDATGQKNVTDEPTPASEEDISYKKITKILILSTLPVIATNIVIFFNESVVFHFLKSQGDLYALGAYGLGGNLLSVISIAVFISMNIGLASRASQAYGAKNYRLVGLCFHRALIINLLLFIPCSCLFYFSDKICLALEYEKQTSYYIQELLSLSIPAMFFLLLFNTMAAYLNACKIFAVPGAIEIVGSIIFWITAYIAIETFKLSVAGAAIAYGVMYLFSFVCIFIYIKFWDPAPGTFFWFCRDSFKDLWSQFKYELLVGSMIYLEWIAYEIINLFAGTLETVQYTALSVANATIMLVLSIPISLGDTVLSMIGNAVGEKNQEKAKRYLKSGVFCSFIAVLFIELAYGLLPKIVAEFYVDDPDTIDQVVTYMHIFLIQLPVDFVQMILASGLRGLGKEKAGTILMLIAYYMIAIPISYVLCHVAHLQGVGLVLGPVINVYFLLVGLLVIYYKLDWDKQIQKVASTVDKEEEAEVEQERQIAPSLRGPEKKVITNLAV